MFARFCWFRCTFYAFLCIHSGGFDQQWLVLLHQFQNLFQLKKNKTQASAPDENIIDGLGYMNPSYDPPSYADALK